MTKIKDLATVTVDSVFRSFPVDLERYELMAFWSRSLDVVREDNPGLLPVGSKDVNIFVAGILETLTRCAVDFKRVYSPDTDTSLPSIVKDRAYRVVKTLKTHLGWGPEEFECQAGMPVEDTVFILCECISIHYAAEMTRLTTAVPKDMELLS